MSSQAETLSDDATLAAIQRGLEDLAADHLVPLDEVREHFERRSES